MCPAGPSLTVSCSKGRAVLGDTQVGLTLWGQLCSLSRGVWECANAAKLWQVTQKARRTPTMAASGGAACVSWGLCRQNVTGVSPWPKDDSQRLVNWSLLVASGPVIFGNIGWWFVRETVHRLWAALSSISDVTEATRPQPLRFASCITRVRQARSKLVSGG